MTIKDDQSTWISPAHLDRGYSRHRPGRKSDLHPDLLPTYRDVIPEEAHDDEYDDGDALNPARGVLLWLIPAVSFWGYCDDAGVVGGAIGRLDILV